MRAVALAVIAVVAAACGREAPPAPAPSEPTIIRCAVIGGMIETSMWPELVARFEAETGHTVKLVATGPKQVIIDAYRRGGVDLITMHASDAMVNLVADGLAVDAEPWARNDLIIVGPADDPAGIRGEPDATVALRKIIAAHAKLLVHATMGADGVLHDLLEAMHGQPALPDGVGVMFSGDDPHAVVTRAAELHAYTIIGRIPFVDGKLTTPGIVLMVRGDPRLRRPFVVETSPKAAPAARELAAWLRAPEAQHWLAEYGKGRYDDAPLFFPLTDAPTTN